MTDITFINPPISMEERYGYLKEAGSLEPPLGLCYLAAVTRHNEFETAIIDSNALNLDFEASVTKVMKQSPRYVGITATTMMIYNAAKVAEMIKERDDSIITIIGGPHITAAPRETMDIFPQFDIGVIGEGEVPIVELLKAYENSHDLKKVDGLIIRKNGETALTKPRAYIKDLDVLPFPAWDLLPDLPKYYRPQPFSFSRLPSTSIITSRGCPNKCIFCTRSVFGNVCRAHSAHYVVDMIEHLIDNYKIKDFSIEDDNFMVFRKRIFELHDLLKEKELEITWSCLGRVDQVNEDVLKKMKDAGCWCIGYGIESGSQKILDFLGKRITLDQIRFALKLTKKVGITTKGYFMFGSPLETKETMRQTINFAKEIDLDDFSLAFLTPLPGSHISKIADNYGEFNNDWKKMSEFHIVFVPHGLTEEDLLEYRKKAVREFYLRPKTVFSYLRRAKNNPWNLFKLLKGAKVALRLFTS